ncbi:uncharacterized protein zgc:113019 [Pseudorasbora parva]|uniref:uncharacterized protein zgc:113019 n=1 Tax=Pseudorasbora parva TaxID=51549 RepID=UPI00351ED402
MPGKHCCVNNCSSSSHDHRGNRRNHVLQYFRFPTWKKHEGPHVSDVTRRRRVSWVAAIRRKDITFDRISESMRVCSLHFHSGKPAYEMFECDPDWAPSLHLGHTEVKPTDTGRFNRRTKRQQALTRNNVAPAQLDLADQRSGMVMAESPDDTSQIDNASQMHEAGTNDNTIEQQECSFCSCRCAEINRLLDENRKLKEELCQKKMEEHFLKEDNVKVTYYTGLPCFAVLMGVLTQLLPYLPQTSRKLSPFQMLLLTLMRLRLNLPVQHIAYLFSVDCKTVSATFRETIDVMFKCLNPLVDWPERHCLQATMPLEFVEAFGNRVTVIADCFEINIGRESNLEVGAQTFSHDTNKHTLKYLIGITPRGAISFVSQGWVGPVSDEHVTENSGLLNKLLPGDFVLADRGDTKDCLDGLKSAEVRARGPTGFDAKDVEETRQIAHLRVHIKRLIGCVRTKYIILNAMVPVSMVLPCQGEVMTFLDKIVTVCCALTNMCPSIVMKPQTIA